MREWQCDSGSGSGSVTGVFTWSCSSQTSCPPTQEVVASQSASTRCRKSRLLLDSGHSIVVGSGQLTVYCRGQCTVVDNGKCNVLNGLLCTAVDSGKSTVMDSVL